MRTDEEDIILWDDAPEPIRDGQQAWKVLIVDDDQQVHTATAYALKDVCIFGRGLELISASSAQEALEISREIEDIAVAIVDVVMETADAGLNLVKALRANGLKDMRVVLRTGFPGYAPELSVVTDYEIDGYFTKDELTRIRLISLLTTSIRAYDGIQAMSRSRDGLELIVRSARQLFKRTSLEMFAEGVLTQVAALLRGSTSGLVGARSAATNEMNIVTGIGRFAGLRGRSLAKVDQKLNAACEAGDSTGEPFRVDDYMGMRFESGSNDQLFAAVEADRPIAQPELDLLRLFSSNITVGFQNLSLIEALDRLAFLDPQLELPNLNVFENALVAALDQARNGFIIKVYICDYQSHLATYGAPIVKKLMHTAYERLRELADDECTIAVVSEGTFGIIDKRGQLSPQQLSLSLNKTYLIDGVKLAPCPTSIMIPMTDLPDDHSQAVRAATAALVHIRSFRDGAHVIYGQSERAAWLRRNRLLEALKANSESFEGLTTFLQPKVDLETGKPVGAEALLRWTYAGEAVSPGEFIPIAESAGLTRGLTEFVLQDVAKWSRQNAASGVAPVPVAVNLSMADLNVPGFSAWLLRRLRELDLSADMIEFEVTEAIGMSGRVALKQVQLLAKGGYRLSLDDFGTGYSSLGRLRQLPFEIVKIDRSFVSNLTDETPGKSLCSVIVAMTELLGLGCIAEGIETEEQRQAILEMGCRYGQGFLFGKPMPMDAYSGRFGLPLAGM